MARSLLPTTGLKKAGPQVPSPSAADEAWLTVGDAGAIQYRGSWAHGTGEPLRYRLDSLGVFHLSGTAALSVTPHATAEYLLDIPSDRHNGRGILSAWMVQAEQVATSLWTRHLRLVWLSDATNPGGLYWPHGGGVITNLRIDIRWLVGSS